MTRRATILLWTAQVLLALAFAAHGWLLLAPPPDVAAAMDAFMPRWFQVGLGGAELAAAAGVTLPALTGILPWLVTWAAGGIIIVMVSATALHLVRAEWSSAAITIVLLAIAIWVVVTRRRSAAGWR